MSNRGKTLKLPIKIISAKNISGNIIFSAMKPKDNKTKRRLKMKNDLQFKNHIV